MGARAKFSAKGQIVIPKDVRDRYSFHIGQTVDVIETPDGVLLRTPQTRKRLTFAEADARMRKLVNYTGPRLAIEDLSWHVIDDNDGY